MMWRAADWRDATAGEFRMLFDCPAAARIGDASLRPLVVAATSRDYQTLAAIRDGFPGDGSVFDRFVGALEQLAAGDAAAAAKAFGEIDAAPWRLAASVFQAVAFAEAGQVTLGLALANRACDRVELLDGLSDACYMVDREIVLAALRYFAAIDQLDTAPQRPLRVAPLVRYLVSYPRSGSTMLRDFLSFAFSAPLYSVYPGDGRYFSRSHHQATPGHPVFVKDHQWRDEYMADESLVLIRDGRDATVSYARFLHAGGYHDRVGRGQLGEFLKLSVAVGGFGFWADHIRAVLDAQRRGARIRIVRYEEIFGNYPALLALAREIAGSALVPRDDEPGLAAFTRASIRRRDQLTGWSRKLELPPDSYIPRNWSAGGGTIDWRHSFDAEARRVFHEHGATEMLIRLGYETDEDWWRAD